MVNYELLSNEQKLEYLKICLGKEGQKVFMSQLGIIPKDTLSERLLEEKKSKFI